MTGPSLLKLAATMARLGVEFGLCPISKAVVNSSSNRSCEGNGGYGKGNRDISATADAKRLKQTQKFVAYVSCEHGFSSETEVALTHCS